jgi:hypothetical protein
MADYRARAAAEGIPAEQVERVLRPLEGLEPAFRTLADSLTFDEEPAVTFRPEENAE